MKTNLDLWAEALTDERLVTDLNKVADDNRYHAPDQRAALLREAARRIAGTATRQAPR